MTANKWDQAAWGTGAAPYVVVVLFASDSLSAVARTAVREAQAASGRLRFIQVHGVTGAPEDEDEQTFTAALRALRDTPRLPVAFETVDARGEEQGEALGELVVKRSRGALVLVLGTATAEEQALLAYADEHAHCDVLAVRGAPEARGDHERIGRAGRVGTDR